MFSLHTYLNGVLFRGNNSLRLNVSRYFKLHYSDAKDLFFGNPNLHLKEAENPSSWVMHVKLLLIFIYGVL